MREVIERSLAQFFFGSLTTTPVACSARGMKYLAVFIVLLALTSLAHALKDGTPAEVKADFDLICNSPALSHADQTKDPSERATRIANYVKAHLKTNQAMKLLQDMPSSGMTPEEKGASLKREAVKAGYTGPCPAHRREGNAPRSERLGRPPSNPRGRSACSAARHDHPFFRCGRILR